MIFEWNDYKNEDAAEIDSWLDEEAVRFTSMDEGWNADAAYWMENTADGMFWCKTISSGGVLTGAVYIVEWNEENQGGFTIGEVLVRPDARGKGIGTAMIKELMDHSIEIIGKRMNSPDAVICASNASSIRMFEKAGFTMKIREDDPTIVDVEFTHSKKRMLS